MLRLLNDGEGTDFALLDEDAALDRRAAENLVAHRDGPDGTFGTADDDLFDTILEVDDVRWVGPSAMGKLAEFALLNDYVPGDDQVLGTFDGVELTYAEAERVLAFVNDATIDELREASVPSRAVTSITEARPVATVAVLAELYWVGPAPSSTFSPRSRSLSAAKRAATPRNAAATSAAPAFPQGASGANAAT